VKCFNQGQTLIEVIVAVGAMSTLLVALLSLVSLSMRNTRLARDRAAAVTLAQEGIELMRAYRDYNWETFKAKANGTSYNLPENWVVTDGLDNVCETELSIRDLFWRCTTLTTVGNSEVTVAVAVGWRESGQDFSTEQNTNLSLWAR